MDEFKPGPKLDTLIAERVFDLKAHPRWANEGLLIDGDEAEPYSTSIEAAWEVVEKLDLLGERICPKWESYGPVYFSLGRSSRGWMISDDRSICEDVIGETPAHVICLAALKAVEISQPQ